MNPKEDYRVKLGVLSLLAVYAIFGITMVSLFFSYLNQSSLTSQSERLTFFNYLFPFFLTIAFVVYFPLSQTFDHNSYKGFKWIRIVLIGSCVGIAIPWQIKHLLWQIEKQQFTVFEFTAYLIGLVFTLGTIFQEFRKLKRSKTAPDILQ